jgi:hypothetical protein
MHSYKHMPCIIENRGGVQERARITHFMEYKGQCHEKDISFLFFEDWNDVHTTKSRTRLILFSKSSGAF